MGQKTHPYGLRVGYIRPWKSRWFATKDYIKFLHEDLKIREFVKKKWGFAGIADVQIERSGRKVKVSISTARPGILIGRRGSEIEKIRDELELHTEGEVQVDIKEIKLPQLEAQLVAENIAQQLVKRVVYRKAMKKAVQLTMMKGAKGIKVMCKGRLGGSEIARTEVLKDGSVPLSTFRADVDYGFAEANTTYGAIGVKTWIYKGEVLVKKDLAERKREQSEKELELERAEQAESEKTKKKPRKKTAAKGKIKEEAKDTVSASDAENVVDKQEASTEQKTEKKLQDQIGQASDNSKTVADEKDKSNPPGESEKDSSSDNSSNEEK